jgi:hypothetical protein
MSWLVFSSLGFITNSIAAYLYGEYIYSTLCGSLCISSIFLHGLRWYTDTHVIHLDELYNNTNITHRLLYLAFIVDKIVLYLVVFSGGYLVYKKMEHIKQTVNNLICCAFILSTFLLTIVLYYYGYAHSIFSFDTNPDVADKWHCVIHWVSSFGHHCILLL